MKKVIEITSLVVFVLATFISCENFLKGAELAEAIRQESYIASSVKPKVLDALPVYVESGTYKNSVIRINFDTPMDIGSLRFSDKETESFPKDQPVLRDSNNAAYAYIKDGTVYFKNIRIEASDGKSLCGNFTAPVLSEDKKTILITPDEYNQLEVEDTKLIRVYVGSKVQNLENVPLSSDYYFSYVVNDKVDKELPVIMGTKVSLNDTVLDLGKPDDNNFSTLLTKNHIRSEVDLEVEGYDYGGGSIFTLVTARQITDKYGDSVTASEKTVSFPLENKTGANHISSFTLELKDSNDTDGLYKISIQLIDAVNNKSEEIKEYYVVRDTYLTVPFKTTLNTPNISFRPQNYMYETYTTKDFYGLEERERVVYISNLEDDVFYEYKKSDGSRISLSTKFQDFTYKMAWNIDFAEIETSDKYDCYSNIVIENAETNKSHTDIVKPYQYYDYVKSHYDSDIYINVVLHDAVGNTCSFYTIAPKKIDIINFDYLNESNKLKINFINQSQLEATADEIFLDKYRKEILYKVCYAKMVEGQDYKALELSRNYSRKAYEDDPWDDYSDSFVIDDIDGSAKYLIAIQPVYRYFYNVNKQYVGEIYGPITCVTDVCPESLFDSTIELPAFNPQIIKLGKNLGKQKIKINYSTMAPDVDYYPAWSTDNVNWTVFEKNLEEIIVPTPLVAPLGDTAIYSDGGTRTEYGEIKKYYGDNGNDNRSSADNLPEYTSTAYLKIIAVKNGKTNESSEKPVVFSSSEHDNIPPVFSSYAVNHNAALSYDGKSIESSYALYSDESVWCEDTVEVYYTKYRPEWGYNLNVLSDSEIEKLPHFTDHVEYYDCYKYVDGVPYFERNAKPFIQTGNLFESGSYMLFLKITDIHGNYTYGAFGKVDINALEESPELKLQYLADDRIKADISLPLSDAVRSQNEFCLYYYTNAVNWRKWYPWDERELGFYSKDSQNLIHNKVYTVCINDESLKEGYKYWDIDTFYRLVSYSYDVDPKTKTFYSNEDKYESGVQVVYANNWTWGEADFYNKYNPYGITVDDSTFPEDYWLYYDVYENETFANQTYAYVGKEPVSYKMKKFYSTKQGVFLEVDQPTMITLAYAPENFGDDIDMWMRKGSLHVTTVYNDKHDPGNCDWYVNTLDSNGNPVEKMISSESIFTDAKNYWKENCYYVFMAHFSDNSEPDISQVYYHKVK